MSAEINRKSVLIADDDQMLTRVLTVRCEHLGLEVRQAYDAMQALLAAHRNPPDLIILDIHMPSGDGLSVCNMLASDPHLSSIPVIVLTGTDDEEIQRRIRQQGAHYIKKSANCWNEIKPVICQLLHLVPVSHEVAGAGSDSLAVSQTRRLAEDADRALVLVVDDDQSITRALDIRLEANGYRVLCAHGGAEAFLMALQHRPSAITLDLKLPELDGQGVLHNLRSHPLTKDIPVIVITGNPSPEPEELCKKLGVFAYVRKPFATLDVMKIIEQAIPGRIQKSRRS